MIVALSKSNELKSNVIVKVRVRSLATRFVPARATISLAVTSARSISVPVRYRLRRA